MGAEEAARMRVVPLGVGKEVTHRWCYSRLESRGTNIKRGAAFQTCSSSMLARADPFPELSVCGSPYSNYRES